MALMQNGFRDRSTGVKLYGLTASNNAVAAAHHSNFAMTGPMRNLTAGEAITDDTVSIPSGNRHPVAWMMPQKPGALSSRNVAVVSLAGAAAGALGRNLQATGTLELAGSATGQLVVSGFGSASFSITASGDTVASLAAAGSAGVSVSGTAGITALAWGEGSGAVTVTGALTSYAVGHLAGEVTPYTELSPQSLAAAVWAQAIEAGYTAEQILRGIAAVNLGAATGLDGANPQYTGLDGSTTRVDGALSGGSRSIDALNLD